MLLFQAISALHEIEHKKSIGRCCEQIRYEYCKSYRIERRIAKFSHDQTGSVTPFIKAEESFNFNAVFFILSLLLGEKNLLHSYDMILIMAILKLFTGNKNAMSISEITSELNSMFSSVRESDADLFAERTLYRKMDALISGLHSPSDAGEYLRRMLMILTKDMKHRNYRKCMYWRYFMLSVSEYRSPNSL